MIRYNRGVGDAATIPIRRVAGSRLVAMLKTAFIAAAATFAAGNAIAQRSEAMGAAMESLIAEIASQEDERARSTVRELLDEPLDLQYEETVADVSIDTATSEHFTGQVIRDGDKIVYASLPATSSFVKSQEWTRAEAFTI